MRERKTTTCTLWAQDGRIYVKSTYDPDWVAWFKANIPPGSRAWDAKQKVWTFDPAFIDEVHAHCESTFDHVTIMEDSASTTGDTGRSVYEEFLEPLPNKTLKSVWKTIAREIHPDLGGDKDVAARVTSAWNRIRQERGI